MATNVWAPISAVFLIWAVGATVGLAYYYQNSQNQQTLIDGYKSVIDNVAIKINLGIDYGNGTTVWHNGTYVPIGATLFNATIKIAAVNYTVYPFGTWISGINGVFENATDNKYWIYSTWSNNTWVMGPVGADQYLLKNGETIKWALTKF